MDIKHSAKVTKEPAGEIKAFDYYQLYHCSMQLNIFFLIWMENLFFLFLFTEKLLKTAMHKLLELLSEYFNLLLI